MPRPSLPVAVALAVLVAAVIAVVLRARADDEPERAPQSSAALKAALEEGTTLAGPPDKRFTLRFTDDWEAMDPDEARRRAPGAIAGLRRRDGSGVLTVAIGDPVRGGVKRLQRELPRRLEQRFDDFDLLSIRVVNVAAGKALYTSFLRRDAGQIGTNLVASEGNRRSFVVDALIRGDAPDTAQQVGAMLRTFDIVRR